MNYSLQEILNGTARQNHHNTGGGKSENSKKLEKSNVNKLIGICFVPIQEWEQIYDEDTAFSAGTIFPSLNKPFLGGGR
jgi:hypothetical protein